MNLYDEFKEVISALETGGIEYALCGGLAMAVHGSPRSTLDVDLLIKPEALESVKSCAKALGYCIDTGFLKTVGDRVRIYRMVKPIVGDEEPVILDLVIVSDELKDVWNNRRQVPWGSNGLSIVSKDGLVKMKELRGSGRDQDDIAFLRDSNED